MAASGASSVKGGNFQIFEHFLAASKASLYLNTTVKSVTRPSSTGAWFIDSTASKTPRAYRTVVLAAPYHQTGISFSSASPLAPVPPQPYVQLHVTLLMPDGGLKPDYFNLKSPSTELNTVLTTYEGVRQHGRTAPEFNSLTYHDVRRRNGSDADAAGGARWTSAAEPTVAKIFSKERVEDAWLEKVFEGQVEVVARKVWDSYPVLPPTTEFPPVKLAEGLYYVNAFEPCVVLPSRFRVWANVSSASRLISTMETETIASRNVVELLMREQYDAGLCPPQKEEVEGDGDEVLHKGEDFVYGWDC